MVLWPRSNYDGLEFQGIYMFFQSLFLDEILSSSLFMTFSPKFQSL